MTKRLNHTGAKKATALSAMNVDSWFPGATYNIAVHVGATFVDKHNALIVRRGSACAARSLSERPRLGRRGSKMRKILNHPRGKNVAAPFAMNVCSRYPGAICSVALHVEETRVDELSVMIRRRGGAYAARSHSGLPQKDQCDGTNG